MFLRAHAISYVSLAADPNPINFNAQCRCGWDRSPNGDFSTKTTMNIHSTFSSIIQNTGIAATELQPRTFREEINDLRPSASWSLSDENAMALKLC